MKVVKCGIKNNFNMTNNQTNLLLLSTMTSLFQGLTFYLIDKEKFQPKFFIFTVITCFIYYIFYYKTYLNADKTKSSSQLSQSSILATVSEHR